MILIIENRMPKTSERFHAGQALQIDGQRIGNLVFDFLWTSPRPVGKNNHLVFAQIRNRIDRRLHNAQ